MPTTENPRSGGAMSVNDFARWAGIGRTTAWNEIRLGTLRAIKVSTRTLVTLGDAERWLSSRPSVHENGQSKKRLNSAERRV